MRVRACAIILWAGSALAGAEDQAPEDPPRPLVRVEVEVPLDFVSLPEGARVSVDGTVRCPRTPCRRLTGLGEHEAVFALEGEPPVRLRFRVPQEGPVRADFRAGAQAGVVAVQAAVPTSPGPERAEGPVTVPTPGPPAAADTLQRVAPAKPPPSGDQVAASAVPVPLAPRTVSPPSITGGVPASASAGPLIPPGLPGVTGVGGREVSFRPDAALGASLARQWAALAFCHNVARAKDRAVPVRGRVVLEWTLLPGGRVEQVQVLEDTLGSPTVTDCLTSQLLRLRLPPGKGPVVVRHPVQFPLLGPAGAQLGVESRPAKR